MKTNLLLLLFVLALFTACSNDDLAKNPQELESTKDNVTSQKLGANNAITGYNMRWRNTPAFATSNVETLIDSLQTEMFRYPGGTVTHKWNWQTGQLTNGPGNSDVTHLIGDVKKLADSTNAKVTFVLDVVHSTIQDQINMINAANVPVEYIELGNELYAPEYATKFPTGEDYADLIDTWVPTLRTTYPNAKIGIVMIGRPVGNANPRGRDWNTDIYDNLTVTVDAHIYHVYMSNSEGVSARLGRLDERYIVDASVETWITEYGDKEQDYDETLLLADALVAAPYNATVLLNHCVIAASGKFSKIEKITDSNNYKFTAEGLAFINKFAPPTAPSTLATTEVDCSSINLTWTDNSSNETGFNVYESVSGGTYNLVETTSANTTSSSLTGRSGSTTYSYKVNAVNVNGNSASVTSNNITTSPCNVSYNLTVNATNGTVTPNSGTFAEGANATLTATANSGYEFSGWSGDASGTTNPLTITMDSNKVVTANFTEITGGTTTLTTTDDAYVRNGTYKNNNYGGSANLQIRQVSQANSKRVTYLKFDVSGVSTITSAKLRVSNTGPDGNVLVKKVSNDNWLENTIKWVGKPALGATIGTLQLSGNGVHEIDVTDYITAEIQSDGTVSFALKGSSLTYMSISSKEGASAPQLIIETN